MHSTNCRVAGRQKEASQGASERYALRRCYIVRCVGKPARDHFLAEMGKVGGVAGRWRPMETEEMTSSEYVKRKSTSKGGSDRH